MERKRRKDFHDDFSYERYINRIVDALSVFAYEPTTEMDYYMCHRGIVPKEQCSFCGPRIEAYKAIKDEE